MIQLYSGSLSFCSYNKIIYDIKLNFSLSVSNEIYSRGSESAGKDISYSITKMNKINYSISTSKTHYSYFSNSRSSRCFWIIKFSNMEVVLNVEVTLLQISYKQIIGRKILVAKQVIVNLIGHSQYVILDC
jgi:hypothetical protein